MIAVGRYGVGFEQGVADERLVTHGSREERRHGAAVRSSMTTRSLVLSHESAASRAMGHVGDVEVADIVGLLCCFGDDGRCRDGEGVARWTPAFVTAARCEMQVR